MTAVRAAIMAAIILTLALTPALVRGFGLTISSGLPAYAAPANQRHPEKDDNKKHGENGNDNHNGKNDNNSNNDNSNDNGKTHITIPRPPAPAAQPAPACSTPGKEMSFSSDDGRVTVHVFSSLPSSLRVTIRKPVDAASVPPVPGTKVDDLLFEIRVETCGGERVAEFPSEVNLGVRYTDADVGGLNEASFKIAHLDDPNGGSTGWRDESKQAADPAGNYVSATITHTGYFVVHVP
jgi:hypothetical protein